MEMSRKEKQAKKNSTVVKLSVLGTVTIAAVILLLNAFTIVSVGEEASVSSFGSVKEGKVLTGFNMVAPWWDIDSYNLQPTTTTIDNLGLASQDKFKTQMDVAITGAYVQGLADVTRASTGTAKRYFTTHVDRRIKACLTKAGGDVKDSQDFFTQNTQVQMATFTMGCVNDYLKLEGGGAYAISAVQFSDINLDKRVQQFMVDTKQRQEQENQQTSALKIADLKSQEVVKAAESNKKAAKLNGEAKNFASDAIKYAMVQEAAGNKALKASITPELAQYIKAKSWNGVMPTHVLGENTVQMLK